MSDDYIQTLLADNETIIARARQHWMALIRFALQPIAIAIAALVCLAIGTWLNPAGDGLIADLVRWIDTLLGLLTLGLVLLAAAWLPIQVYRWTKRRYIVTDRRVMFAEGAVRRTSAAAGLNMITDVGYRETFLGRQMGYGDLVIATAANKPLEFRQMVKALDFKKAVMDAQQGIVQDRANQILAASGMAPMPRPAAGVAAAGVAGGTATVAPAVPQEPAPPAWGGGDVPQMAEDDRPPADPAIFGSAPGPEVGATASVEPAPEARAAPVPPGVDAAESAAARSPAGTIVPQSVDPASVAAEAALDTVAETAIATGETASAGAVERAATTTGAGGHAKALGAAGAATAAAIPSEPTGADTITETLAKLADLRDEGAITAEDYEAKKRDLLDRL